MSYGENLPLNSLVTADVFYDQFKARLENEDPNQRDGNGRNLLHIAAMCPMDNSKILKLLIKRVADINSKTKRGLTPLHFAVINRQLDTVEVLIAAGASINSEDVTGKTALHFSIPLHRRGEAESNLNAADPSLIRERLLCHPQINLDHADESGETPLMRAVKEHDFRAVLELLKKLADPNLPDKNLRTPLHVALSFGNARHDIALALLTSRAGLYSVDSSQLTPIDILLGIVREDGALSFGVACVRLIALIYPIERSLEQKLGQITELRVCLYDCCREVRLMKRLVIYGNVTLHDFCIKRFFQTQAEDRMQDIFLPVLQILLTAVLERYGNLIFSRISTQDWHSVLRSIVGESSTLDLVANDASSSTVYHAIKRVYLENAGLNAHIIKFKEFLVNEIQH